MPSTCTYTARITPWVLDSVLRTLGWPLRRGKELPPVAICCSRTTLGPTFRGLEARNWGLFIWPGWRMPLPTKILRLS